MPPSSSPISSPNGTGPGSPSIGVSLEVERGRGHGAARPERLRQDHDPADPHRLPPAVVRRRPIAGLDVVHDPLAAAPGSATCRRTRRSTAGCGSASSSRFMARLKGPRGAAGRVVEAVTAWPPRRARRRRRQAHRGCRAATGSASPSAQALLRRPGVLCSTSPPTGSTRARSSRCGATSGPWRASAPWWSPPTSWARSSGSPTGWRSCSRAGCSACTRSGPAASGQRLRLRVRGQEERRRAPVWRGCPACSAVASSARRRPASGATCSRPASEPSRRPGRRALVAARLRPPRDGARPRWTWRRCSSALTGRPEAAA